MKDDNSSKLNQYCRFHRYVHTESYELCDYCMVHTDHLIHRDKYYNFGLSRRMIAICKGCEDSLFGGGEYRIIIADEAYDIHERICQVIKDRTRKQEQVIDYYEAVRIAYSKNTQHFIEYFGEDDVSTDEINKNFRGLWSLTYRFVNEEQRINITVPSSAEITDIEKEGFTSTNQTLQIDKRSVTSRTRSIS